MRQVTSMRGVHSQNGVSGLEGGKIYRHIGLGAGVRLDVDMIGPEELFGPLDSQGLHDIDKFAPIVVSLSRVTFGVFVGHDAALGFENRLAHKIFRWNQFQFSRLSPGFLENGTGYVGICIH